MEDLERLSFVPDMRNFALEKEGDWSYTIGQIGPVAQWQSSCLLSNWL